ncbi:MAG: hypothetical protein U1E05_22710 [Patescibacteria group bacterium]|nr:hypothetical protein [Patescibacteria group bacterium]
MVKKVVIMSAGTMLVVLVLFGTSAMSYLRTSGGYMKQAVHDSVPMEFQIDRARNMISDLTPEVRKNLQVIAREEVEVQRLEERIERSKERLAQEKSQIVRLTEDLAKQQAEYTYAERTYTAEQVRTDLTNRFNRYKTGDATLASLEQIHAARQRSVHAARQRLEGMLAARRQLEVEVENLEARRQMIAAAETTSRFHFDDSQLGRVKELIADLRTRLDVADQLVQAESDFHPEIPLDNPTSENVVEEVSQYFERGESSEAKLARADLPVVLD